MLLVLIKKFNSKNIFLLFSTLILFTACSKVNVVLLPEENNKLGRIEIKNNDKTFFVDKAYQQVNIIEGTSEILTKDEVLEKFKDSINTLPAKPLTFLLYFQWDSNKIVPKSTNILKKILKEAKKDTTVYIDIIGYTDRAGNEKYNKKLSLRRAKNISNILLKNNISKDKISIEYYGEANPMVQTRDGVARKVNRRVEVTIK